MKTNPATMITVQYFAVLADRIGIREEYIDSSGLADVDALLDVLGGEHDVIGELRSTLAAAVNDQYASGHTPLNAGDTVSLIPPVSGG
jgi:molybdopterin converting factor subunit 1